MLLSLRLPDAFGHRCLRVFVVVQRPAQLVQRWVTPTFQDSKPTLTADNLHKLVPE